MITGQKVYLHLLVTKESLKMYHGLKMNSGYHESLSEGKTLNLIVQ